MQSQRISVRNTLQIYEGQFIYNTILKCLHQSCYICLKKGTIYIYPSKRSYLNNPNSPSQFFNLDNSSIKREGNTVIIGNRFHEKKLWNAMEEQAVKLEESALYNKGHMDVQKIFPKKFVDINTRIDEKLHFQKSSG